MSGYAAKTNAQNAAAHPGMRTDVIAKAMDHHRGIDPFEAAAADHVFLAGMPLLRWGPLEEDATGHRRGGVQHGSSRQESSNARCGDDVMPARVPNLRQGIVFRQDGHSGMPFRVEICTLPGSFKRGLHAVDPAARGEAMLFNDVREHRHGTMFFERRFRVSVQVRDDVRGLLPQGLSPRGRRIPELRLAWVVLSLFFRWCCGRHALGDALLHRFQIRCRWIVALIHALNQS